MVHVRQYTRKQKRRDMKRITDPLKKMLKLDKKRNRELRRESFKT
jgi:hypothetical protein